MAIFVNFEVPHPFSNLIFLLSTFLIPFNSAQSPTLFINIIDKPQSSFDSLPLIISLLNLVLNVQFIKFFENQFLLV